MTKNDRTVVGGGGTTALQRKYGGYVSPDRAEQHPEAVDMAEDEARHTEICGCGKR